MPLLNVRDLLEFPTTPGNANDTLISGIHFNLTTLKYWNYTYYSNGTLSNGSWCILSFDPYTPQTLLANGTFMNSTSCYTPIKSIGPRGFTGVAFSVYFAISIMFTLIHLRKHGRLFLPAEKRFRPVGRRWQWYWLAATGAMGMIAGIGSIDVDRYYLPEFPIVLTNLGYFLMLICVMGAVWESVRHWGSWQERQMIDPDPFVLPQDDRRGTTEFYLPLVFYLFNFLNFFMTIPRSWDPIEAQRSVDQTAEVAEPNSTDIRWKVGAILMFLAWLVVCFSLWHSLRHYKPRNRGLFNRFIGFFRYTPIKFLLIIPLALVMIGYEALIAWDFSYSSLNVKGNLVFIYGMGWGPIALIILVFEISGYLERNEDKELIRQRRVRGAAIDAEMGYVKKPNWWSRLHGDQYLNVHQAIAKNVREVGGGAATTKKLGRDIEMGVLPAGGTSEERERRSSKTQTPDAVRIGASLLFPSGGGVSPHPTQYSDRPRQDLSGRGRDAGRGTADSTTRGSGMSERSTSTASGTTLNAPPQQIRSMLDV